MISHDFAKQNHDCARQKHAFARQKHAFARLAKQKHDFARQIMLLPGKSTGGGQAVVSLDKNGQESTRIDKLDNIW